MDINSDRQDPLELVMYVRCELYQGVMNSILK